MEPLPVTPDSESVVSPPEDVEAINVQVLFMDIVEFTINLVRDQRKLAIELTSIVKNTKAFAERGVRRTRFIPTGDGMAIVFMDTGSPVAIECAFEVAEAVQKYNEQGTPRLDLKMGIHKDYVVEYTDIRGEDNVAGRAINLAERIMSSGGKGHILAATDAAETFQQLGSIVFQRLPLGNFSFKHGEEKSLSLLWQETLGTQTPPTRKPIIEVIAERAECYQTGNELIMRATEAVYSMICFPDEFPNGYKGPGERPPYVDSYFAALHATPARGCTLHRLFNLKSEGIKEYADKEFLSLIDKPGAAICVAETHCDYVDVLIGCGGVNDREALVTFPTDPNKGGQYLAADDGKQRPKTDAQYIHWGIYIRDHKIVGDLRDWYEYRLKEGEYFPKATFSRHLAGHVQSSNK
jgi:class 3 adenylate cyclase